MKGARRSNVERKAARLGAQKTDKAMNCAINTLLRTKLPRGSAHKKVKTLTDVINKARTLLMAVGQEHRLFSVKTTIEIQVSNLKEETQSRWYLYLTKASGRQEEVLFGRGLESRGGQQRIFF